MYTVRYFILCTEAEQDEETGEITCERIFDRYVINELPGLINFTMVVGIDGLKIHKTNTFKVHFINSNGELMAKTDFKLKNDNSSFSPVKLLVNISNMPIQESGIHKIQVLHTNDVLGEYQFEVLYREEG